MPIYGFACVFPKLFFTGSVAVGIIWLFCNVIAVGIYPLWEGRHSTMCVTEGLSAMKKPAGLPEEKD
ncbi:sodium symporter family protein [Colletotrichum truncatum]|uniref:Sodium symporter family protein n=1 Tax=Colletotrichum truncatum TaxID=5467 RepID=A0ACC3ZG43_COLTU